MKIGADVFRKAEAVVRPARRSAARRERLPAETLPGEAPYSRKFPYVNKADVSSIAVSHKHNG